MSFIKFHDDMILFTVKCLHCPNHALCTRCVLSEPPTTWTWKVVSSKQLCSNINTGRSVMHVYIHMYQIKAYFIHIIKHVITINPQFMYLYYTGTKNIYKTYYLHNIFIITCFRTHHTWLCAKLLGYSICLLWILINWCRYVGRYGMHTQCTCIQDVSAIGVQTPSGEVQTMKKNTAINFPIKLYKLPVLPTHLGFWGNSFQIFNFGLV